MELKDLEELTGCRLIPETYLKKLENKKISDIEGLKIYSFFMTTPRYTSNAILGYSDENSSSFISSIRESVKERLLSLDLKNFSTSEIYITLKIWNLNSGRSIRRFFKASKINLNK